MDDKELETMLILKKIGRLGTVNDLAFVLWKSFISTIEVLIWFDEYFRFSGSLGLFMRNISCGKNLM